jgi:hypothetical protein
VYQIFLRIVSGPASGLLHHAEVVLKAQKVSAKILADGKVPRQQLRAQVVIECCGICRHGFLKVIGYHLKTGRTLSARISFSTTKSAVIVDPSRLLAIL